MMTGQTKRDFLGEKDLLKLNFISIILITVTFAIEICHLKLFYTFLGFSLSTLLSIVYIFVVFNAQG